MEEYNNDGAVVRHYLLGELAEDEQRRFEEELMSGARSFDELLAAEDELIDQYVAGALAGPERERFRQHFLATPERRRKLSFARTLHRYVADAAIEELSVEGAIGDAPSAALSSTKAATDEESADKASTNEASTYTEPSHTTGDATRPSVRGRLLPSFFRGQPPLLRYAVTAVLLLFVSVGALLVFDAARGPRTGGTIVAFTLAPGAVRGASDGGVKQIDIAPDTGIVVLRLALAAPARQRYRADIVTIDEDRPVFSTPEEAKPVTTDNGTHIFVRVPADRLAPGNYKLTLTGAPTGGAFEHVAAYYFRVNR